MVILGWNPHTKSASNQFLGYWWLLKSTHGVKHFGPLKMNNRQGCRSSKHIVSLACTFHSVVFNLKDMPQMRVICSHKICRFLSNKKCLFLSRHSYPFIVTCYAQQLLFFNGVELLITCACPGVDRHPVACLLSCRLLPTWLVWFRSQHVLLLLCLSLPS